MLFAATAGFVGALGRRLWDRPTGRRAALAYATSVLPFVAGNTLTPETALAACGAALAYAYWRVETAAGRERSGWWLLAGLGLLAKGPALLVLLPPFALHLALRRRLGAAVRSPGQSRRGRPADGDVGRDWRRSAAQGWRRLAVSPAGLLVLLWVAPPLAVYLSASSRLPLYALPIFAPLALATGRGL